VGTYTASMYNTLTQQPVEVVNPLKTVTPAPQHTARLEEFRPSRAPEYLDILPGYIQNDTLPTFMLKCYDRFGNLTDYNGALTLQSDNAAVPQTIPIPMRRLTRGLYESNPLILTQHGNFVLTASGLDDGGPFAAAGGGTGGGGSTVTLAGLVVLEQIAAVQEIPLIGVPLTCVNPMIMPFKPYSTAGVDQISKDLDTPTIPILDKYKGYELFWSDEFSFRSGDNTKNGLNTTKWTIESGYAEERTYLQDTPRNVHINSNGELQVTARYQTDKLRVGDKDYRITSGKVISRYRSDWRYGIYVFKAKMPNFIGMWGATWLFSSENGSPYAEIDFPEVVEGANFFVTKSDMGNYSIWCSDAKGLQDERFKKHTKHRFSDIPGPGRPAQVWHEYIVRWVRDTVEIYVDELIPAYMVNRLTKNSPEAVNGWWYNYFPMHGIITMPVGGRWPEGRFFWDQVTDPSEFFKSPWTNMTEKYLEDNLTQGQSMLVDYMRVYKQHEDTKPIIVNGTGFYPGCQVLLYDNIDAYLAKSECARTFV
jgi:beta-glucanase (GH16 family)